MSSPLGTDTKQLAAAADRLDALVQERMQREQRVSVIAEELAGKFKGKAGEAFQQVVSHYVTASQALTNEEASIAEKLAQAGIAYNATDAGSAQALGSTMGI
jgi:uncharacterized protein YukE